MAEIRQVISTLSNDGREVMGPSVLAYHYPDNDILNGSLLTVESNHFAVSKSRGVILNVYDTGQYTIQTPDRPIVGAFQQAFFGENSPWQYEVIYINRAKLILEVTGIAYSREMAEMGYHVSCYIHVDTKDDALKLVQHMPFADHYVVMKEVNTYAGPVVEQSVNSIVQLTELERVNEKMPEILEIVKEHLQDFLSVYGLTLNDAKALVFPKDERMKELISLRAFGLSELEAVRYYTAMIMAQNGIVSAPNMAVAPKTATAQLLCGWLNAWSYNFGDPIHLLREKMVQLHNVCEQALADYTRQLQTELKTLRRKIPRPTRENPYPDMADPLEAVKELEAYMREVEALRVRIHSLSVPANDMVYHGLTENQQMFESLAEFDRELLNTLSEVTDESITSVYRILDERSRLLQVS
jgi:membrane protease subunit (stomatin/prohibitin family)